MAIRGVLFDKDDTLIDLGAFWLEPVRRMAAALEERWGPEAADPQGLRRALEEAAGFSGERLIPGSPVAAGTNRDMAEVWEQLLLRRGAAPGPDFLPRTEAALERACTRYGQIRGRADFARLLPDLRRQGLALGVATSDSYEPTIHCLRALGIADAFDRIFTADRVKRPKPDPEMARRFCGELGLAPGEVVMVGDSANDMRFAANSGLIGLYFDPAGSEADPLPPGARRHIARLEALPELLEREL
jgi:phosphoglycolate phosphatase